MSTYWQAALKTLWGIEADLTRLDGEYDLNFLAETEGQAYVLKVMRPGCEAEFVALQCGAFGHISASAPNVPVPNIVNTPSGENYIEVRRRGRYAPCLAFGEV